jgi:hypothetical protein
MAEMSQAAEKSMLFKRWLAGAMATATTFLFAASAAFALTMSSAFNDAFPLTHLGIVLLAILLIYILWHPRILFCREFTLYAAFVAYMFVQLLWTRDHFLALNTLVPAVNFAIILVLFGSLVSFHKLEVVLKGFMGGVFTGSLIYSYTRPASPIMRWRPCIFLACS